MKMKKLLALLLALMLVLTMAACGSDEKADDKKDDDTSTGEKVEDTNTEAPSTSAPSEEPEDEPTIAPSTDLSTVLVGKWNATMKGTDVVEAMKAMLGEAADSFDFSGVTKSFSIQYDFNQAGVVRISFDAEALKATYGEIFAAMGVTGADLDAAIESSYESAKGEFDKQSPYEVKDNELYVSGAAYAKIEIVNANTLTMIDDTGIPVTMTRVA